MTPLRFDFPLITNSDYAEELSFQVRDTYLDITGHSFAAQIRVSPNATSVLASLDPVSASGPQGFYSPEPSSGALQVRILWESIRSIFLSAYPSHLIGDAVSLYYDLLVTLPSGDREVWLFGYLNVSKGITNG